ncbi:hypothetical protein N474_18585 [Pseudoalteromonas luteoviolacea CPMOR-2]|nr:hypothetical protein N474_18585 [Pseudoalteromonas luteoviolacea CPMOR-2]
MNRMAQIYGAEYIGDKMKLFMYLLLLSIPHFAMSAIGDKVTTQSFVVKEVRVQLYNNDAFYYFVPQGSDWSAPNCPAAAYAYIKESQAGAQAILSVALTSKTTNTPVRFTGTCGDISGSPGYIGITDIIM